MSGLSHLRQTAFLCPIGKNKIKIYKQYGNVSSESKWVLR